MAEDIQNSFGSVSIPGKDFKFPWKGVQSHTTQNTKLTPFRLGRVDPLRKVVKESAGEKPKNSLLDTVSRMIATVGIAGTAAYLLQRNAGGVSPTQPNVSPTQPNVSPKPEIVSQPAPEPTTNAVVDRPLTQMGLAAFTYPFHFLKNFVNPSGKLLGATPGSIADQFLTEDQVGKTLNRAVSGTIGGTGLYALGKPIYDAVRSRGVSPVGKFMTSTAKTIPLWHFGVSTLPGLTEAASNIHRALATDSIQPIKDIPGRISKLYTQNAESDLQRDVPQLNSKLQTGQEFSPSDTAKMWWHLVSGNPLGMLTHLTGPAHEDGNTVQNASTMELGRLAANEALRRGEIHSKSIGEWVAQSNQDPTIRNALAKMHSDDVRSLAELANIHQRSAERMNKMKLTNMDVADPVRSMLGYPTIRSQWDEDINKTRAFFNSPAYSRWQETRNALIDSGRNSSEADRVMGPIGGITNKQLGDLSHYLRKFDTAAGN